MKFIFGLIIIITFITGCSIFIEKSLDIDIKNTEFEINKISLKIDNNLYSSIGSNFEKKDVILFGNILIKNKYMHSIKIEKIKLDLFKNNDKIGFKIINLSDFYLTSGDSKEIRFNIDLKEDFNQSRDDLFKIGITIDTKYLNRNKVIIVEKIL